MAARARHVNANTSGFTLTEMTGPSCSMMSGTTTRCVFPEPDGAQTIFDRNARARNKTGLRPPSSNNPIRSRVESPAADTNSATSRRDAHRRDDRRHSSKPPDPPDIPGE
ncbi:MAG: hypothetical protein LBJ44_11975 [Propionibacteriaceae bacterium]|nr:hypothetical protein [Propionibacteriaceae bacterium]